MDYSLKDLLPFLELDEYISFDLETTGLNPDKDQITEIAACRFVNGEFTEEYTTLINPGIPIPKNITALTGISNKMVEESPSINDVLPEFLEFVGSTPLVAQNINFDYSFITKNLSTERSPLLDNPLYDTLSLARGFIYFHNSFNLGSLCDYYGIKIENAHRAGADALCTGKLFAYLIQETLSKPLTLIQRIDNLFGNANVYNYNLFKNIIKTSVRFNKIDGLMPAPIEHELSDNSYEFTASGKSAIPEISEAWFVDGGAISVNWGGFEKRTSQTELIKDAFETFTEGNILAAEAGTGLGKSLAYLSSGYLAAKQKQTALVVSTYTKNLQSQLFTEDIPKLSQAIDQDLSAVIYKGRYNYICRTRFERLLANHQHLIKPKEYENILPLLVWEWETKSGDINECNGFQLNRQKRLWSLLRSERGYCSSKRCSKYDGCFLGKVRVKVEDADIIIINHSLFANELMRDNSCLPEDFIYVIDEAHHFATVTRDQLVTQVGAKSFDDVFKFFNPGKDNWKKNALNKFPELLNLYKFLATESKIIQKEFHNFFNSYYDNKRDEISRSDYHINKLLYRNSQEEFIDTEPTPWEVLSDLIGFEKNVQNFNSLLQENKDDIAGSFNIEFTAINGILKEGLESLTAALDMESELVQWSSFVQSDFQNLTALNSAPLKVSSFINDNLLSKYPGGVFCSATLMINDDFRYFNEKVGLDLAVIDNHVIEKVYYSPFHYNDQVKLFVFSGSINVNDPLFMNEIGSQIERIFTSLKKRMLVLCTSFKQTLALKQFIEPKLKGSDNKIFVQAPGISRNVLVRSYLEHPHSILIGTSSFWEGVDFPGDKVEILFIVKTPFDNPFDPLIQAQIEDYNQRGDDAFLKYQVPEAAMRFRQGFGRLIRNMNDAGICIVGDTRLLKRGYGKTILGSLPVEPIPYQTVDSLLYESQKFF
jgi:predicted DnaQ family exonuclease/DinG family helicase|tara:strand:+ start:5899 stop:8706 length:2808 start_codon:yes stop_codon:yes gene_type:complete